MKLFSPGGCPGGGIKPNLATAFGAFSVFAVNCAECSPVVCSGNICYAALRVNDRWT